MRSTQYAVTSMHTLEGRNLGRNHFFLDLLLAKARVPSISSHCQPINIFLDLPTECLETVRRQYAVTSTQYIHSTQYTVHRTQRWQDANHLAIVTTVGAHG